MDQLILSTVERWSNFFSSGDSLIQGAVSSFDTGFLPGFMETVFQRFGKQPIPDSQTFRFRWILEDFESLCKKDPNKLMYCWLDKNAEVVRSFTRGQLWSYSRDLAYKLSTEHGLKKGDRAMIVYPFGIDFLVTFVALLRIGVIIVSVYPPNPAKLSVDIPKFSHFVKDSGAVIALTTRKYKTMVTASKVTHRNWPVGLAWVATDSYSARPIAPSTWHGLREVESEDVALLQYTSGSTGAPKGTMITNRNMAHNSLFFRKGMATFHKNHLRPDLNITVAWCPQYHDMGLFAGYIYQLSGGGTTYGMSPLTFLRDPTIWVKAMKKYDASFTMGPNFAYALCAKRLQALEGQPGIEYPRLDKLTTAVLGAEPSDLGILPDVERYMGISPQAMKHSYGQAETTLVIASGGGIKSYPDGLWSVGYLSMSKDNDTDIRIVKVDTNPSSIPKGKELLPAIREQPDGEEGEIWVSSPSVCAGYWNKADLTEEVFHNKLPGTERDPTAQTYLRTGDMGFKRDKQLFISSRIKDLIIVRGRNISPTDVERAAENAFPKDIRPGCSVAFQVGPESVVVICETRPGAGKSQALERLAEQVRSHVEAEVDIGIEEVLLCRKGTTPKTTSGKVQRRKCKQLYEEGKLRSSARAGQEKRSQRLHQAESLGELIMMAAGGDKADASLSLAENGIDSIQLVQLVDMARDRFGVTIPYSITATMSVGELIDHLENLRSEDADESVAVPERFDPREKHSARDMAKYLPPTLVNALNQVLVLILTFAVIALCTIPSTLYINKFWDDSSQLWVVNGRAGPLATLSVIIWMVTFSLVFVAIKWICVGRMTEDGFRKMWSTGFARWWLVQRLAGVWNYVIAAFLTDTIWINMVYKLLGADVALSARIRVPFQEWDLVSIGSNSDVKGLLYPRLFHWSGVKFGKITIGSHAVVGSRCVVQPWSKIGDGQTVEPMSTVPPYTSLEGDVGSKWRGVPATLVNGEVSDYVPSSTVATLLRSSFPFVFACAIMMSSYTANLVVPAPDTGAYLETWSPASLYLVFSYILVYELTGTIMLAGTVLLKWSFLSPYLVDRFADLVHTLFFPYVQKNFLLKYWFMLFGLRLGKGSVLSHPVSAIDASVAHRVSVGDYAFVPSVAFVPKAAPLGTAENVMQWLLSGLRLRNPWATIFCKKDIIVGRGVECGVGTRIEEGVVLEEGSVGTAAFARLLPGTRVCESERVIGNPVSLTLRKEPQDAAEQGGDEKDIEGQVPVKNSKPRRFVSVWSGKSFAAHVILTLSHVVYLTAAVLVILEAVRSLPVYDENGWELWQRVPVLTLLLVACVVAMLVLELVLYKRLLFGKINLSADGSRFGSVRAVLFYHGQAIWEVQEAIIFALFGGMFVLNGIFKLLGARVPLWSVFNNGAYPDPGDADGITIRRYAVLDAYTYAVGHRADNGRLLQGRCVINEGAVVHPSACFQLGSAGRHTQLFPLSKTLGAAHLGDGQIWIGCPAVSAKVDVPPERKSDDPKKKKRKSSRIPFLDSKKRRSPNLEEKSSSRFSLSAVVEHGQV